MRMLYGREYNGYEVMKQLANEGVRLRSNYIYMVLTEMEEKGMLKGRWNENAEGPRKHFHSLSEDGVTEYRRRQRGSLDFLMGTYIRTNFSRTDLPGLIQTYGRFVAQVLDTLDVPSPNMQGVRFVVTVPYCDPLTYHPIEYYAMSESFPKASVYLVKPKEMKLYEERPNLFLVDGFRHDIPLKDVFADFLYLRGFPKCVSEDNCLRECLRVLKSDGHLIVQLSTIMTQEKSPVCPSFSEFLSRLFYDVYEQDRVVSLDAAKSLLSNHFKKVRDIESCGNIYLYANKRKEVDTIKVVASNR